MCRIPASAWPQLTDDFRTLLLGHQPQVRWLARRHAARIERPQDAEDIAQAVLLRLWRGGGGSTRPAPRWTGHRSPASSGETSCPSPARCGSGGRCWRALSWWGGRWIALPARSRRPSPPKRWPRSGWRWAGCHRNYRRVVEGRMAGKDLAALANGASHQAVHSAYKRGLGLLTEGLKAFAAG